MLSHFTHPMFLGCMDAQCLCFVGNTSCIILEEDDSRCVSAPRAGLPVSLVTTAQMFGGNTAKAGLEAH